VRLPLQDFVAELTVEKVASALLNTEGGFRSPLVQLQSDGPKRPLYFLHGDFESGGFYCRELARGLGADQPFCVIHPHGLDGDSVPRTIEEMAADRVKTLLAFQSGGPYRLGGYCVGGAVAVEMARQLRARGESVEVVVLIDTRAPNAPHRRAAKLVEHATALLRLSPETGARLFRRMRSFLGGLKEASSRGRLARIAFVLRKPYSVVGGALEEAANSSQPGPLSGRQALWLAYHQALETYVPEPYGGRLVLFRSSHLDVNAPGGVAAGWEAVSPHVEVHRVSGNHESCVTTHVAEICRGIKAALGAQG
jgi:thioesterase domain-containing protein